VYHIFNMSSTKGLEESFIFSEWQFIQYILPCFVTLIGQHATNSKTKPTELLAYTRFVHNLIQSFEQNLTIMKQVKGDPSPLVCKVKKDLPDWVCMRISIALTRQLEEVESELGVLIFGSHKRQKRADPSDVLLGQSFFLLLKESLRTLLTTYLTHINSPRSPMVFRCWDEILLQSIPRMKKAIMKEQILPTNPFPANNLIYAISLVQELATIVSFCTHHVNDKVINGCLELANHKLKKLLGKSPAPLTENLEKKLFLELQKLSVQQLLGLALFDICYSNNSNRLFFAPEATKMFRSAMVNVAVEKYDAKDWRGLRSLLMPLLSDEKGNDLSTVTMEFAKKSASTCYKQVLDMFKTKNSEREKFLSLLPVIPIKLCRCCGKCEGKLSMCEVCVDNQDFPDIHWFCSQECEEKVLADGHLFEHGRFLEEKLGL
jgi:hypothetical protein